MKALSSSDAAGQDTKDTEGMIKSSNTDICYSAEGSNLAYVVRVQDLRPIKGKDRIEVAVLRGWQCIVQKGTFAVGDLALYFAIGAVPDFDDPHFSFLRDIGHKRIKTIKMGKVISQGLLGQLDWLVARGHDISDLKEGDDVSAAMGVRKFVAAEESAQYAGPSAREAFPQCVPKTDATRLQHDPERFLCGISDRAIMITRKEDGCSCSFIHLHGSVKICGRNFVWSAEDAASTARHYFSVAEKYRVVEKLSDLGRDIAVQGEIVGPKVNGNRLQLDDLEFRVFDIFDIDGQRFMLHHEVAELCATMELPHVPVLFCGKATEVERTVDGFLQRADAVEYAKGIAGEGIVVKTIDDPMPAERVVFKVISNKYLLKHDL